MRFPRVTLGRAIGVATIAVAALVPLELGAGQDQTSHTPEYVRLSCGDASVNIDPTNGTDLKAVYLCAGNKITWNANHHQFIVIFRKSPFTDDRKIFDNNNYVSRPAKNDTALTVYNYLVIVDGQLVDDPQIVGGGGHN
jgi:hypothetical protein